MYYIYWSIVFFITLFFCGILIYKLDKILQELRKDNHGKNKIK